MPEAAPRVKQAVLQVPAGAPRVSHAALRLPGGASQMPNAVIPLLEVDRQKTRSASRKKKRVVDRGSVCWWDADGDKLVTAARPFRSVI